MQLSERLRRIRDGDGSPNTRVVQAYLDDEARGALNTELAQRLVRRGKMGYLLPPSACLLMLD